jgi:hypothetical protein
MCYRCDIADAADDGNWDRVIRIAQEQKAEHERCTCGHRKDEHPDGVCIAKGDTYHGRWADDCVAYQPR